MSIEIRLLCLCLSLFLVAFGLGCPPTPMPGDDDDNDDNDDNDAGDDDAGDDDASDDDVGDDDETPQYTGEIDVSGAHLSSSCAATVPASNPNGGEGHYDFEIDLSGWASMCWIELWDLTSQYCEGYNPNTGNPCNTDGYTRPGWDMTNTDFGWNNNDGFWDVWDLHLLYHNTWPPPSSKSIFMCENAGTNFQTWYCCCDMATDNCFCTEFSNW